MVRRREQHITSTATVIQYPWQLHRTKKMQTVVRSSAKMKYKDWQCSGAIINLSVQVSHRHRNSWKAHILPQKVYKSANWNESSVEWTLVDLDFAFVIISNFEVVPQPRK